MEQIENILIFQNALIGACMGLLFLIAMRGRK